MNFQVNPLEDKQRLDHVLAKRFPDISRSFLQSLCKTEQVFVNGKPEKSGYKLRWDDTIDIQYDFAKVGHVPDIDIPIIYEDDDVIVVNKPTGVLSHALSKFKNEASVASFLRQHSKSKDFSSRSERYGIVHRLDRLTSGVMVCAKNDKAMKFLQQQFADRTVTKEYVAITSKIPKHDTATIAVPVERNPKAPATFRPGTNGKLAETTYKMIKTANSRALLLLRPKTGRTHQLRVHLAYIGCPIAGDVLYGGGSAVRLMLHASKLSLELPNGDHKTFSAPIPEEFNKELINL